MLRIPNSYKAPLIQIIVWNIEVYFNPNAKVDEFRSRLKRIMNALESESGNAEVAEESIIWIKEAVENAWNSQDTCVVSPKDIETLLDWIRPIYLAR